MNLRCICTDGKQFSSWNCNFFLQHCAGIMLRKGITISFRQILRMRQSTEWGTSWLQSLETVEKMHEANKIKVAPFSSLPFRLSPIRPKLILLGPRQSPLQSHLNQGWETLLTCPQYNPGTALTRDLRNRENPTFHPECERHLTFHLNNGPLLQPQCNSWKSSFA